MMSALIPQQKMTDQRHSTDDEIWMEEALSLAARGLYSTSPNPRVGCVIVSDGQAIGRGWHERAGQDHAEVMALKQAGQRALGACAYVTLEPCNHHGRTPPCVDALIAAGVSRVVVGNTDPDPRTKGQGIERLRAAGIEVIQGVCADASEALNIGFLNRHRVGRPWVRLKTAISVDGRTTAANGQSQWITSPEARQDAHHWRARACALITGIGTVLADDPMLNARPETDQPIVQPARIIMDSQGQTPKHAKILGIDSPVGIMSVQPKPRWVEDHPHLSWVCVPSDSSGRVSIEPVMAWLSDQEFNEVHIEAGPQLSGAWITAGLVDELLVYQAPVLLGEGQPLASLPNIETLEDKEKLEQIEVKAIGPDLRLRFRCLHQGLTDTKCSLD